MALSDRLEEYVRACFTGLWIRSHEHDDALLDIAQLARGKNWRLATWDIDRGLVLSGSSGDTTSATDPLAAVRAASALAAPDSPVLVVLKNFHRFLASAEIVQALVHQVAAGKQHRVFFLILSPVVQIPIELGKLFAVVEHELPARQQLLAIARGIATEEGELPVDGELDRVLDAAAGLTRYEAEGAFSLALVRHERIEPQTVWELKSQTLLKGGLLSLYRGPHSFKDLGGLDSLKAFCLRALRPGRQPLSDCRPRGVLTLGVAGSGKSAFCKALGNETGRPTLVLDVGSLMGSLVGQTEERTREALRIVDCMQPAILMIDEVEKALSGVAASGQGDAGVSTRMFGTLLSWLNDHESDVFVVCTANDVSRLPPEFSRAERFDAIFFLDLPERTQKDAIWRQYIAGYELDPSQRVPDDDRWTAAEIKSCCRLAGLLDVPLVQAAHNVVPVAVTSAESVERLRSWASGRCLSADVPGIYQCDAKTATSRRRIHRDPSNN
jgi:hypothetical protein